MKIIFGLSLFFKRSTFVGSACSLVFSSPPQRPPTSKDFYTRSYPWLGIELGTFRTLSRRRYIWSWKACRNLFFFFTKQCTILYWFSCPSLLLPHTNNLSHIEAIDFYSFCYCEQKVIANFLKWQQWYSVLICLRACTVHWPIGNFYLFYPGNRLEKS